MGFLYALREVAKGNFQNAFNGAFVSDDILAANDQAGDALSKKIASQQASGLISAEQANQLYGQLAPSSDSDAYWSSSGDTPLQVFNSTLETEAGNIGQFGSSAINKVLGLGSKLIPWQVYVLLFILLLVWLYPVWKPFAASLSKSK